MNRRRTNHITALPRSDKRMDLHHLVHPASRHSSPAVTNSPLYPTSEPLRHDMDTPSQPPSHCQHNRTISDPTNFRILPRSSTPPPPRPPTPPRFRTQSNNRHEHYIHVGESHSAPIISSTPLPALPLPSFGVPTQGRGRQQPRRQRAESDSSSIITARRDFAVAITRPSPRRGYLQCKLCDREVWGPNGRYHIDKCPVLQNSRETARNHGARLTSVSGIPVHPDVFKSARRPRPKVAKIPGFVMSHSVSIDDPRRALTEEELDAGEKRGRKGYVRCLRCNSEVFAPNARYHASHCETETHL